jgi:hypothetical protein
MRTRLARVGAVHSLSPRIRYVALYHVRDMSCLAPAAPGAARAAFRWRSATRHASRPPVVVLWRWIARPTPAEAFSVFRQLGGVCGVYGDCGVWQEEAGQPPLHRTPSRDKYRVSRRQGTVPPPVQAGGQRCAFTSALTPQVRRAHCSAAAHAVSAQLTTRVHRAHESYEAVRHGVVVRRHSRCDGRSRARNL